MKIAFDMQPVLSGTKSGVGFHEDGLIKALMKLYPEQSYYLNFFFVRNKSEKKKAVEQYRAGKKVIGRGRCFPGGMFRWMSTFLPIPYALFFRERVDVTHFFNYYIPPFVRGKRVVTIHDMAFQRYPETVYAKTRYFLRFILKRSVKRADRIITVSEFSKAEIQKFYRVPAEKIAVVPNGVDTQRFHPDYTSKQKELIRKKYGIASEKYFLFLGNIEPRKNLVRLLEAYEVFVKKLEGQETPMLVLAGGKGWLYDEIFAKAEQGILKGKVCFTGYVEDEDVPVIMAGAEIFCFLSFYEGFGMPVIEAMACGTPVLVSKGTVLEEIVEDAGVAAEPFSAESIANGLLVLFQNQKLREDKILLGFERVEKYTWKAAGEKLYRVYEEISKKR